MLVYTNKIVNRNLKFKKIYKKKLTSRIIGIKINV